MLQVSQKTVAITFLLTEQFFLFLEKISVHRFSFSMFPTELLVRNLETKKIWRHNNIQFL